MVEYSRYFGSEPGHIAGMEPVNCSENADALDIAHRRLVGIRLSIIEIGDQPACGHRYSGATERDVLTWIS